MPDHVAVAAGRGLAPRQGLQAQHLGGTGKVASAGRSPLRQPVYGQGIALHAKAAHHGPGHARQVGVVTKRLARMHVADVQLHQRHARALTASSNATLVCV